MSDSDYDSDGSSDSEVSARHLYEEIRSIQSAGQFATGGRIQSFDNPGLQIDEDRPLSLPLSTEDVKYLISLSQQALFGKGLKTVIDKKVRKTWQIDADRVSFTTKRWDDCLARITLAAATELGSADPTTVCPELYKLLIYEENGKFRAHQDTEKSKGMFATLIVCLPSPHEGGEVVLKHQRKELSFATDEESDFDASYIAWYSDVTHEVKPVEAGFRCVLSYNLINEQKPECTAKELSANVKHLADVLDECAGKDVRVYPLEHRYTTAGLRLSSLKGVDYKRVAQVSNACALREKHRLLLANMELRATDLQDDDPEVERPEKLYSTRVADLDGSNLTVYNELKVDVSRMVAPSHWRDRDPDAQNGGGYMGNQHAEIHQFYKDSVMVIVPNELFVRFLTTGNATHTAYETLLHLLESRWSASDLALHGEDIRTVCQDIISGRAVVAGGKQENNRVLGSIAVAATWLADAELLRQATQRSTACFTWATYSALGANIDLQEPLVPLPQLSEILIAHGSIAAKFKNIDCYKAGFLENNDDCNNPVQQQYLTSWLDSTRCLALSTASPDDASPADAQNLVEWITLRQDRALHQFVLHQTIRQFAARASANISFITPLLLHITKEIRRDLKSPEPLSSLLDHIVKPFSTHFDLAIYLDQARLSDHGGLQYLLGLFRQRGFDKVVPTILNRARIQAPQLEPTQVGKRMPALLVELLEGFDKASRQEKSCAVAMLDAYAQKYVGQEPIKPTDWRRPEEVAKCWDPCDVCDQMNEFLREDVESCKIPASNLFHAGEQFPHVEVGRSSSDDPSIMATKTFKKWEKVHQDWEQRLASATKMIARLPEEPLRQCLGKRYDEFVGLEMLKKVEDEDENGTPDAGAGPAVPSVPRTTRSRSQKGQVIPKKRARNSSGRFTAERS